MGAMALPKPVDLALVPLFAMLGDDERELLARNLDELDFEPGQALIVEGKGNHTFFVVREGLVEVAVPGKAPMTLGAGSVFGEISMDRHVPATATVTTRTRVRAYVMSHAQFQALKANDQLMLRLRALMVERLLENRQPGR
jgi:CRP-like cAMP-binding protein